MNNTECEVCHQKFSSYRGLGCHIVRIHQISTQEYYDNFLKSSKEGICPVCSKKTKFYNLNRGYQRYCSLKCVQSSEEVKQKKEKTSLERYGHKSWNQSEEIKKKQQESIFKKYGVYNIQQIPEVNKKSIETRVKNNLAAFGVEWCAQLPKVKEKISNSVKNTMSQFSKEKISDMYKKQRESKRKNGTLSTSSDEEKFYEWLCGLFNKEDIYRNHRDERYPFNCDFYIKSLDLFIELNLYFTHGKHWFDENNAADVEQLQWLINKTKLEKHPQYEANIKVWTVSDPLKRKYAVKNNLNYVVLWNEKDIREFKEAGIYEWI